MQPESNNRGKWRDQKVHFLSTAKKYIICISLAIVSLFLILFFVFNPVLHDPDYKRSKQIQISEKSLLVLPFKNMNISDSDQYLADGVTENVINNFFMIRDLKVIPKSTSIHFGENIMGDSEIAGKLNVNFVLEGSVHRDGNLVKIIAELLDVKINQHIMSEKFEGEISDIFLLQNEIVKGVSEKLGVSPTYEDLQQIEKVPTQNEEAYDSYLKARVLFEKANFVQQIRIDKESLEGSLIFFEKAVSADTNFAAAYAGLANVWFALASWDWTDSFDRKISKAKEYSLKALEIDPYCAEAHAVKGACLVWPDRQYEAGRMELLISHQLNPNFPVADLQYTHLLMITGPLEQARKYINQALERESYSWILHNLNAWLYYFEEKYQESIDACKIAIEFNPEYIFNKWLLYLNYFKTGKGEEAAKELQVIMREVSESAVYDQEILDIYKKNGTIGLFKWLIDLNINKPLKTIGLDGDPFLLSWWYAVSGEKEESLFWLEKSMETAKDFAYSITLATNPDFDILREDPRFLAIIDKLGLTPYNSRQAKAFSFSATAF